MYHVSIAAKWGRVPFQYDCASGGKELSFDMAAHCTVVTHAPRPSQTALLACPLFPSLDALVAPTITATTSTPASILPLFPFPNLNLAPFDPLSPPSMQRRRPGTQQVDRRIEQEAIDDFGIRDAQVVHAEQALAVAGQEAAKVGLDVRVAQQGEAALYEAGALGGFHLRECWCCVWRGGFR